MKKKSSGRKTGVILAIAVVMAVIAGVAVFFEKSLKETKKTGHGIPSKPVIKGVDPLLAIKGCLFDLGASKGEVEFDGDRILVSIKEKVPEDKLEEAFEPIRKIGKVEVADEKHVAVIMDSRKWEIEIIYPPGGVSSLPTVIKPGMGKNARIAIIIDDMGLNLKAASRLAQIDRGLSFSVLPYTDKSGEVASFLHSRGCDVMVHLPMQGAPGKNPGKGAIMSGMDEGQVLAVLKDDLNSIPYAVGASNHMGSQITMDREKMTVILDELERRRLFYVDSMTTPDSVCLDVAREVGEPIARRDVFLDNELDSAYITGQLERLKKIAVKNGYAIGICHPHEETIAVLEKEIPKLRSQGIDLVPVSKFAKKR